MIANDQVLADAFHQTLKDVYFAEKLASRALQRAARMVTSRTLRRTLSRQGEQRAGHVERLNRVFRLIEKSARVRTNKPIQDMTAAVQTYLAVATSDAAANAVLISWTQTMNLYSIRHYGALKDWSSKLGLDSAESVIAEMLQEVSQSVDEMARVGDDFDADDAIEPPRVRASTALRTGPQA